MHEIIGNFHLHTRCSDGAGSHQEVAHAAAQAGLDVIFYTDHNMWLPNKEGWYTDPQTGSRVLRLMGEEVHDEDRSPQANHYLCLGTDRTMIEYARQPQALIDAVKHHGGVGFIAHPVERAAPLFDEPDLPWVTWEAKGFTGIEVWNYMSEFKAYLLSKPVAVSAAYFPSLFISGPFPESLALWDKLLATGQKVAAIGGADAHANVYSLGPFKRLVFPYAYLFGAVNTHLLLEAPLYDELAPAKAQVLEALQAGHAFVAYDLAGDSRGFRFTASHRGVSVYMGDGIRLAGPVNLHATSPLSADLRLLQDGREIVRTHGKELDYTTDTLGIFRVEAYRRYRIRRRGWIFSNPIYVFE
jgi:hypothetical protein